MPGGGDGKLIIKRPRPKQVFFSNSGPQNPNLTTTQPKPNLNMVGFDTIITLHNHHPTGTLLLPEIMILGVGNFVGDLN